MRGESKGGEDGKRAARLLQLYIEAVSIHSQRNLNNPNLTFTIKDYYAIQVTIINKQITIFILYLIIISESVIIA